MNRASLALLGGVIYLVLVVTSSWNDSATYDEPTHIYSGYLCLVQGRFDINNFHPPLTKMIAVLGLAWNPPSFDEEYLNSHRPTTPTDKLSAQWFWTNASDPQTMLRSCRLSLQLFQALLIGVCLYLLSGLGGRRATLVLLLLAFLSPPFVGISSYVITDAANSLFTLLTLLGFHRLTASGGSRGSFLLLTLFLFGGLSTKHSFLLLPALLLVLCLAASIRERVSGTQRRWLLHLRSLIAALFVALISTLALYGFCMRNMEFEYVSQGLKSAGRYVPVLTLVADHRPLHPVGLYVTGISRAVNLVQRPQYTTAVLSDVYQGGQATYFPILLAAKENSIVLGLLVVFLGQVVVQKQRPQALLLAATSLTFSACYSAIAMFGSLNIGFRHILPAYLAFFLCASLFTKVWSRTLLSLLLVARLFSLVATFPHYLGYFNVFAGGVDRGYLVSVVSDADWSQDFLRLRQFMDQRKGRVFVYPASPIDPEYYLGPYYVPPDSRPFRTGDLVAVSTTYLRIPSYLKGSWKEQVAQASHFPKVGQIGGSIVIYEVP